MYNNFSEKTWSKYTHALHLVSFYTASMPTFGQLIIFCELPCKELVLGGL